LLRHFPESHRRNRLQQKHHLDQHPAPVFLITSAGESCTCGCRKRRLCSRHVSFLSNTLLLIPQSHLSSSTNTAHISRDECLILNELLSRTDTPIGCYSLTHNSGNDKFTYAHSENKFQGEDATHHRNSWLMPRMACRLTQSSKFHVSQWRQAVEVNADECEAIRTALEKNTGVSDVLEKLPNACKSL